MKHIWKLIWVCILMISTPSFSSPAIPSNKHVEQNHSMHLVLPNGLKVLLVSNAEAVVSAASLTIGSGQRSAPRNFPGLPHLLEHIVFLGDKSFPIKNSWDKYIKKHNGWSNGSTRSTNTRYHFQLNHDGFNGALYRLKSMVTTPLITAEAVNISLSEVDEEFSTGITNEWLGILSVIRETTSITNTASIFGTGNNESLAHDKNGLQQALIDFHQTHYTTNNMTLALYSNQSLDSLKALVQHVFKGIKPSKNSIDVQTSKLHKAANLGKLITIKSNSDQSTLDLRFEVPPKHIGRNNDTANYIAELIGHEGKGSIFHYLNQQGLANGLSVVFQGDELNEVFNIYVQLTNNAEKSYKQVLETIFAYISMLKTNEHPPYIQEEIIQLSAKAYAKPIQKEPGDWMSDLSDRLHLVNPEHVFSSQFQHKRIPNSAIQNYLQFLTPTNMQAFLSSPKAITTEHKITKYYNKQYTTAHIPISDLLNWERKKIPELSFPIKNKYISAAITPKVKAPLAAHILKPKSLSADNVLLINIKLPKGKLETSIAVNKVMGTHIATSLGDNSYYALLAGYQLEITSSANMITVMVFGDTENITSYASDLVSNMQNNELTEIAFNKLKATAYRNVEDLLYEKQYKQTFANFMNKARGLPNTKITLSAINNLTFTQYRNFLTRLPHSVEIIASSSISDKRLKRSFSVKTTKANENIKQRTKSNISLIDTTYSPEGNALIYSWLALEGDLETEAFLYVINDLISRDYQRYLRENQKVAYIADTKFTLSNSSLSFIAESSKLTAKELEMLTQEFILNFFHVKLSSLSDSEFEAALHRVLTNLERTGKVEKQLDSLNTQYQRGFKNFDYNAKISHQLNKLTKEKLIRLYKPYIARFNKSVTE